MKKIDLSIVVPCYNEEKNIPLLVERFKSVLSKDINAELIMVDNGSTDGSHKLIQGYAKKYPFIKMAHVPVNIGYGHGVWTGIKAARGEFIGWTHADMQTDLNDAFIAYNIIKQQPAPEKVFAKGKRKGRKAFDRLFTLGMSIFELFILRKWMPEINAQPSIFHKSLRYLMSNPPDDFSLDLYAYYMAKKNGYKIIRFPVLFPPRIHGESNWNTGIKAKWKFIKRIISYSRKLKKSLKAVETTRVN